MTRHPIAVKPGPTEPSSVKSALVDSDWTAAMKAELLALSQNETWSLVPASPSQKVIGNKWVFKVKYLPSGAVQRYKARLVAKGFSQTP